jgi:hypothetical protein
MTGTAVEMHRAVYAVNSIPIKYNLKISVNKTKKMAVKGKRNVRTKIVINNHIAEQVNSYNYLGYVFMVTNNRDLEIKLNRFNEMCSTIRILNNKTRKDTWIKLYKAIAVPIHTYRYEIWTIKNQEGKIETAEMKFLRSVAGYTRKDQTRQGKK